MSYQEQEDKIIEVITWLTQIAQGDAATEVDVDGVTKPSISKAIDDNFELIRSLVQGTRAFLTKAEMDLTAWSASDLKLARVVNDSTASNNGLYYWKEPDNVWTKTIYDYVSMIDDMQEQIDQETLDRTSNFNENKNLISVVYAESEQIETGEDGLSSGGITLTADRFYVSSKSLFESRSNVKSIELYVSSVGDGNINFVVYEGDGDIYKAVKSVPLVVNDTGVVTLTAGVDFDSFEVQEGQVIGVQALTSGAVVARDVGTNGHYYFEGDAGSGYQSYTSGAHSVQIKVTSEELEINKLSTDVELVNKSIGELSEINKINSNISTYDNSSDLVTSFSALNNGTYVNVAAAEISGYITDLSVQFRFLRNGSFYFMVFDGASGTYTEMSRTLLHAASVGVVAYKSGVDFDPIYIEKGQKIGVYVVTDGPEINYHESGGAYRIDGDAAGETFTGSGQNQALAITANIQESIKSQFYPWADRGLYIIGDSITAQNLYVSNLVSKTAMNLVGSDGINGEVLQNMADNLVSGDLDDVEILLCGTGVNNWHHGASVAGTQTDSSSTNSMWGAVRNIVEIVYGLNPNTHVVFWGPINSGEYTTGPAYGEANTAGMTIADCSDAMQEAAAYYGSSFINTRAIVGVNEFNLTDHMSDSLHPDTAFAEKVGDELGNAINNIQRF